MPVNEKFGRKWFDDISRHTWQASAFPDIYPAHSILSVTKLDNAYGALQTLLSIIFTKASWSIFGRGPKGKKFCILRGSELCLLKQRISIK